MFRSATADTVLIQTRVLKALNDFAQKYGKPLAAYAQASDTITKLQWQISASIKKCGAVSIRGQVRSMDNASVSLWGVTAPYGCDQTEYGCDQPNHWDEEGVPGILHEESNVVLSPYSTDLKTDGKAIVGEELSVTGYCYSKTGLGTNALTTKGPVYKFAPCVCIKSLRELEQKLELYRSRSNEILDGIGISASDLAFVASLAQSATNTQEGTGTKDPH